MATSSGAAIPAQLLAGGGAFFSKFAHTVWFPLALKLQPALPLHAPPQPTNDEATSACEDSETLVPAVTVMLQVPGQSMPGGEEVTRPAPVPGNSTLTRAEPGGGGGSAVKVAVTSRSASIVTLQEAIPEHAPDQPVNVDPAAAVATSCTGTLPETGWVHDALQVNTGAVERTSPLPLPATWTLSECVVPPPPPPPEPSPPVVSRGAHANPRTTTPATAILSPMSAVSNSAPTHP